MDSFTMNPHRSSEVLNRARLKEIMNGVPLRI